MTRLADRLRRIRAQVLAPLHLPPDGLRLVHVDPCYWVVDVLTRDSVMLDMGLGFDADFSVAMIQRFGLTSHGFDPTRKHMEALRRVAETSGGRFIFHPLAIGGKRGTLKFHESNENVSGSMLTGHKNIKRDTITTYDVQVITLADALREAGVERADLVKLDIEGPEYEALEGADDEVLQAADQWCVEFHHHLIDGIDYSRTKRAVARFRQLGFRDFTRDSVNFLFYRTDITPSR